MYPLLLPSFPNLLGNSFYSCFFFTPPSPIQSLEFICLCYANLSVWDWTHLNTWFQLASGGADRKDEFFHFSVSPFCTQPRSIKATFLHGALIYFSPLHNAAQAVRCMNKERESLSLCLSLMLDSKARSISKIMDISRGDQRRWFWQCETRVYLELRIAQISSISVTGNFS